MALAAWFRRLVGREGGRGQEARAALWMDVRCNRCQEVIGVRVDPTYELRQEAEAGRQVKILDKDVLGTGCFALLHVHAVFTQDLTLLEHHVAGGELVDLRRTEG
jgi:hypothetical protein